MGYEKPNVNKRSLGINEWGDPLWRCRTKMTDKKSNAYKRSLCVSDGYVISAAK